MCVWPTSLTGCELRQNRGADAYEEEYRIGLGEPADSIVRDARIVEHLGAR